MCNSELVATLTHSTAKLVDVAFGIKKLQIACVVEDEKVGIDFLEEGITAFEDHVSTSLVLVC